MNSMKQNRIQSSLIFLIWFTVFIAFVIIGDIGLNAVTRNDNTIISNQLMADSQLTYQRQIEEILETHNNSLLVANSTKTVVVDGSYMENTSNSDATISRGGIPERTINVSGKTILEPSELSADQFNAMIDEFTDHLPSSKLKGLGETMVTFEETYHLNALYAISITFESGYGVYMANTNNLIGARSGNSYRSYDTPGDCIMHLGDFLTRLYIDKGITTIDAISKKYCPPKSEHWENSVMSGYAKLENIAYNL